MRVLVTGGRDFTDYSAVARALDHQFASASSTPMLVMQGGARGADYLAYEWCARNGVPCDTYRADWAKHGRAAGPIRNAEMIEKGRPDLVIAFSGGRGTADCVRQARVAGVPVREIKPEASPSLFG